MSALSVIIFILALCVIILVHEIGHFAAAKLFGMNAYQFNLGMGPVLLKKTYKGTQYALRAFPIGGSVMLGEDDEPTDDPRAFRNKPVWQRVIVLAAGAFLNLVLGLILFAVINTANPIATTTIARFEDDAVSNTGAAALQVGDRIVKIEGMNIISATEISYKLENTVARRVSSGESQEQDYVLYDFTVIRGGERVELSGVRFAATLNESGGASVVRDYIVLGLFDDVPEGVRAKTFLDVVDYSFRDVLSTARIVWLTLMDLIRGTYGINELASPIGIADTIAQGVEQTPGIDIRGIVMMILRVSAFVTVNLGIVNMLPVPALDGARILFLGVEAVRRKPLNANAENIVHFVGFALLMLLMVVIAFNDIRRLIFGG